MAGKSASPTPNNKWVSLLNKLDTLEIAEVLNDVCLDCQSLLRSRLLNKINEKTVDVECAKVGILSISSSGTSPVSTQLSNHERTPGNRESSTSPVNLFSSPINGKTQMSDLFGPGVSMSSKNDGPSSPVGNGLGEEWGRFLHVKRKKKFLHYERVNGKEINVLQGLELHTGVFSAEEQKKIVESVYDFQKMGRKHQLMARTYSEPLKWMRGKGRITMQFGCCYNYAVDKEGNPPGIVRDEEVDPLPPVFKDMISRMVRWHVLPPTCVPNSCIVNIYDEGDCIPPHIDHHDFLRPFCTVSFLTECNILFGSNLKIAGPGEFTGPVAIPLPVGSVLVLKGNGADVAKHCVPAVPAKRISVTFRRMDDTKMPFSFSPDPDLLNLRPLRDPSMAKAGMTTQVPHSETKINGQGAKPNKKEADNHAFLMQNGDFPPLGGTANGVKLRTGTR